MSWSNPPEPEKVNLEEKIEKLSKLGSSLRAFLALEARSLKVSEEEQALVLAHLLGIFAASLCCTKIIREGRAVPKVPHEVHEIMQEFVWEVFKGSYRDSVEQITKELEPMLQVAKVLGIDPNEVQAAMDRGKKDGDETP